MNANPDESRAQRRPAWRRLTKSYRELQSDFPHSHFTAVEALLKENPSLAKKPKPEQFVEVVRHFAIELMIRKRRDENPKEMPEYHLSQNIFSFFKSLIPSTQPKHMQFYADFFSELKKLTLASEAEVAPEVKVEFFKLLRQVFQNSIPQEYMASLCKALPASEIVCGPARQYEGGFRELCRDVVLLGLKMESLSERLAFLDKMIEAGDLLRAPESDDFSHWGYRHLVKAREEAEVELKLKSGETIKAYLDEMRKIAKNPELGNEAKDAAIKAKVSKAAEMLSITEFQILVRWFEGSKSVMGVLKESRSLFSFGYPPIYGEVYAIINAKLAEKAKGPVKKAEGDDAVSVASNASSVTASTGFSQEVTGGGAAGGGGPGISSVEPVSAKPLSKDAAVFFGGSSGPASTPAPTPVGEDVGIKKSALVGVPTIPIEP